MYKLTNYDLIIRIEDNAFIPIDFNNEDYKTYLLWVADDNNPEPADEEPKVMLVCTRRQGRLAFLRTGYLSQVEDYINSIEDAEKKMEATIEYETETWESTNKFVVSIWALLGGTPEGLDDLFILAATL